jgi:hypothetical protein
MKLAWHCHKSTGAVLCARLHYHPINDLTNKGNNLMSEKKSKKTLGVLISSLLLFVFATGLITQLLSFGWSTPTASFMWSLIFCALIGFYLRACLKERAAYFRQAKTNEGTKNLGIVYSYLGGSGYSFHQSEKVHLLLTPEGLKIALVSNGASVDIPFTEIHELEISGPGTTTNNAGISGGGFGLEGFAKGAVAAALINAATTKNSTNTFARMLTTTGELYLHTSQAEPAQLKIGLSQVFVSIANKTRNSSNSSIQGAVTEEITKLHKLKQDGLIDDDEYKAAKSKLLGISV